MQSSWRLFCKIFNDFTFLNDLFFYMFTKAKLLSLFSIIVYLKYVFSCFKIEEVCSSVAVVIGSVVNIFNSNFILSTISVNTAHGRYGPCALLPPLDMPLSLLVPIFSIFLIICLFGYTLLNLIKEKL